MAYLAISCAISWIDPARTFNVEAVKPQVTMRMLTDTKDRFLSGYRYSTQTTSEPVQHAQVRISRLYSIFLQNLYRRRVYEEDSLYLPS